MKMLCNTWLNGFFGFFSTLKAFYDEGSSSVIKIFSNCNQDYESFIEEEYEKMYEAAECVRCKTIYYPNDEGNIDDDCEYAYDIWFISSRDMTEFYKTLNKLYKERKISWQEYSNYKRDMYNLARRYILYSASAYYGGVSFYLRTKTNHKYASSVSVYIDMNCCGGLFEITCGVAALLDAYSAKLNELREKYFNEDDEYWRRYDWIKSMD